MNNYNYDFHKHNELRLPQFESSFTKKNLSSGPNCIEYAKSFHPEPLVTNNKRKLIANSLPQIAIKRKDNETSSSRNTEVVLINGNWDTSNKIPNIIAEMHNVNIEELQAIQNTSGNNKLINVDCPSPLGSDSGIEGDCSDGNLSWLLNYKINELPPVPDCNSAETKQTMSTIANTHYTIINNEEIVSKHLYIDQVHLLADLSRPVEFALEDVSGTIGTATALFDAFSGMGAPKPSTRYVGPKKPPFTYTELIEHALVEKGELTVSGIYQWISDHFPFYKQNDDRWKNSVRHNLSINPHFRKGGKAPHGAGHLWTISQREDKKTWNIKKQRMQNFMEKTMNEYSKEKQLEMELATATASIMPESTHVEYHNINLNGQPAFQCIDKRQNIEVEYVIDVTDGLGDFLCPPVSKEQVVEECGLGNDFLITDLNPATLGLNLTEAEIINGTTVSNLYDDLNFHCYEMTTE